MRASVIITRTTHDILYDVIKWSLTYGRVVVVSTPSHTHNLMETSPAPNAAAENQSFGHKKAPRMHSTVKGMRALKPHLLRVV